MHSELDDIKGIGPKSKDALLKAFKSVKRMKEASRDELVKAIGESKTDILIKYWEKESEK